MKNTFLAKTYTITLTVPRAIALSIGSLVLISWFFFLGLIVGRGYEPENIIPQVAQIMPQPGDTAPFQPGDSASPSATGSLAAQQAQPVQQNKQGQLGETNGRSLIAEADKNYRESIKHEGAASRQAAPPSLTPPPAGTRQAQQGSQATAQTGAQTGDATAYAFVYQLASFKEEKAAQALRDKLSTAGFKTRINTSKGSKSTWYRVIIDFTGTNAQAETAKTRLKKDFKLGEPLKLSQKKTG